MWTCEWGSYVNQSVVCLAGSIRLRRMHLRGNVCSRVLRLGTFDMACKFCTYCRVCVGGGGGGGGHWTR